MLKISPNFSINEGKYQHGDFFYITCNYYIISTFHITMSRPYNIDLGMIYFLEFICSSVSVNRIRQVQYSLGGLQI